ncbi:DUF6247 family protein [Nonomuraea sp. NPDC000554]|uniref:DUF6247 family protein n=1 Tax=Nonomuraea sp. NPDC000554 TaxID=3154259 RepID=UPI0033278C03
MTNKPVDYPRFDPQAILQALPKERRPLFLAEYEEAVEAARKPDQFYRLYHLLNRWWLDSITPVESEFGRHQAEPVAIDGRLPWCDEQSGR